jgi:replicative DNA helicase
LSKTAGTAARIPAKPIKWMHEYCQQVSANIPARIKKTKSPLSAWSDMGKQFLDYATNFETNVIKTGIAELDDNATLCASTLNGLLGQPGAGKTTVAIQYLRNTSLANVPSMFFSLDMGLPIVYAKLAQKLTGLDFKSVMALFRDNPMKAAEIATVIQEEYKNVGFNFRSGMTIADMKTAIKEQQDQIGQGIKLIVIDYLECIAGPYSDATANTGFIANQLKDLANDFGACVLLLLQTQKHSTPSISDPLMTLKAVKGSSVIEQSCSSILTLWREGYSPDTIKDDRYISFAVVKNRFGSLWRGDFSWDGVRGSINSLTDEERAALKDFKSRKAYAAVQKLKEQSGVRTYSVDEDWN